MASVLRNPKLAQYEKERLEHTPWVEKYRPKSLDDVAAQDHAVRVLKQTLASANLPHMLFYGPPGTGKTSTVLALAKQLYGPLLYKTRVLELNASDERGINIVREKIKNFARLIVSNPLKEDLASYPCPPYKIIILDEADSMTKDAQSALRRTMETYSGATRFCLICNYITRIIDPLASRCSKFRFRLLNNENALARLQHIVDSEGVQMQNQNVLSDVLRVSNGDLRKAITYLQLATRLQASLRLVEGSEDTDMDQDAPITSATINEIAGVLSKPLMDDVAAVIASKDTKRIISFINDVILEGWSAQQVVDQLHDHYILDDSISSVVKNRIAAILFDTDRMLNSGSDEHIQLLNLALKVAQEL